MCLIYNFSLILTQIICIPTLYCKIDQNICNLQVIYNQNVIVEALKTGLAKSTPLSLQPTLELISGALKGWISLFQKQDYVEFQIFNC